MKKIPVSMQAIFWSQPVDSLDLDKNKSYIIHQVLNYGNLDDITWLKNIYSKSDIVSTFVNQPVKIYYPSTLNFIKNYILNIKQTIDESKYLKTTARNI